MPSKILIKRGLSANLTALTLSAGEPAFATDTGKLYVGNGSTKILINDTSTVTSFATMVFCLGATLNVAFDKTVPFTNLSNINPNIILEPNGGITLKQLGSYLIHYHVSASVTDMQLALRTSSIGSGYETGTATRATSLGSTPYCCCSASAAYMLNQPKTFYLVNRSNIALPIADNLCTISILKL